jgi:hypothetical protein
MPAGSAHHISKGDGQPCRAASLAPIQALLPVGPVVLAVRTDQHLHPAGHRARPRHLALVGIEGGAVAEEAARPVRRPHDQEGYPFWPMEAAGRARGHADGEENRSVSTASSTIVLFSWYSPAIPRVSVVCTINVVSGSSSTRYW